MDDQERLQNWARGYQRLQLGESLDLVTGVMGEPTKRTLAYSKKDPAARPGTMLEYNLNTSALPNMNDASITLVFDAAGRLIWGYPQNIAGLQELGSRSS